MNILFCGDSGVCRGMFYSAVSLCKHTKEDLVFYILTASIENRKAVTPDFAQKLQKAVGGNNKVILLDISEKFCGYLPLANMNTRFTPLCMLRLFADITPEIPEKILYLDTDVLCRADFSGLYKTDMAEFHIAGVPDRYGKWFFGNILKHNYLNSGVLLMNMEKIRKDEVFLKCREMCRDKKMFMPDQTALNKLAKKRKISAKYNNQGKIKENTVFKHFTTYFKFFPYIKTVTIKPWESEKLHNELKIFEFDDILKSYERQDNNEQRNTDIFYN